MEELWKMTISDEISAFGIWKQAEELNIVLGHHSSLINFVIAYIYGSEVDEDNLD